MPVISANSKAHLGCSTPSNCSQRWPKQQGSNVENQAQNTG